MKTELQIKVDAAVRKALIEGNISVEDAIVEVIVDAVIKATLGVLTKLTEDLLKLHTCKVEELCPK